MTTLKQWVLNTYERDELIHIANIDCASYAPHGLIYYSETTAMHDKYEDEIWDWLYNLSNEMGDISIMHTIASFNGAKDVGSMIHLQNLLVWAYVEHIAFYHIEESACEEEMV